MNRVLISTRRFERDARILIRKRPQARDDLELVLGLLAEDAFHPSLKTHKLKGALEGSFACSVTHDVRILFEFIQHEGPARLCC